MVNFLKANFPSKRMNLEALLYCASDCKYNKVFRNYRSFIGQFFFLIS